RDVEALREAGHRDAEGARAGGERLGRGAFMLVSERERDGAVGLQIRVVDGAVVEVAGPDFEAARFQFGGCGPAGRVQLDVEPLVGILRVAAVGEGVLRFVGDDARAAVADDFAVVEYGGGVVEVAYS